MDKEVSETTGREINERARHLVFFGLEEERGTDRYVGAAIAAVKIVAAIAAKVYSLKSDKKKAEALAEISNKLNEIIAQLHEIRTDLRLIKEQLDTIEDKIDEMPFTEALATINALQQFISENFEYWTKAPEKILVDAREARRNLITNNRKLMSGSKFSYAFDLAFSFAYELDLAILLDIPEQTVKNATTKMISYLEAAIDPNEKGSIAYHHAISSAVVDQLLVWEASLQREQYIKTIAIKTKENIWSYVMCIVDEYDAIAGTLETGLIRRRELRDERECQAYQKEKGSLIRQMEQVEALAKDRVLAEQNILDAKNRLYADNKSVVDFANVAIPTIKRVIEYISNRTDAQLPLAPKT